METDKIYFSPGDCVMLRQDIAFKPTMVVVGKDNSFFKLEGSLLKGIKCRWFSADYKLQEAVFNFKDLIKV